MIKKTSEIKTGINYRSAEIVQRDLENRTIDLSFSSEEPVERTFGMEILDHSEGSVNLNFISSGRAPLLVDHDTTDVVGVVEAARIDDVSRVARASVRFGKSERAAEIFADVTDGPPFIRSNISVGYSINEMQRQERNQEDREVFRVVDWTPLEISLVSIPADQSDKVGVGRNTDEFSTLISEKEKQTMTEDVKAVEPATVAARVATPPAVDLDKIKGDAAKAEQTRVAEILALGTAKNMRDKAIDAIGKGLTVEQFRGEVIDALPNAAPLQVGEPDLTPREQQSYSLMRAIRAAAQNDWRTAEFEREVSDEIGRIGGKPAKGFFVPSHAWGQRDLIAGADADGGHLKAVDHMGGEFIEALRSRLVISSMGARIMSGLKGDVSIPTQATAASAAFVAENNAVSEQNQTFGELSMVPRTLGVMTDISRKLMLQSDPSAEAIVRNDLLNAVAAKIEDVAIEGSGSNEPTGITKKSGIGSVALATNGSAPTWAMITGLVKEVEQDNAAISENMGYITNSKVKSKLASVAKVSSSDSVMLLNAPWNEIYGYPLGITNHVPSDLTKGSTSGSCSAMIFGDFSSLILAFWSSPDVLIDPYTNSSKGGTRVVVFQDCDVGIRYAQSFAACLDVTTT